MTGSGTPTGRATLTQAENRFLREAVRDTGADRVLRRHTARVVRGRVSLLRPLRRPARAPRSAQPRCYLSHRRVAAALRRRGASLRRARDAHAAAPGPVPRSRADRLPRPLLHLPPAREPPARRLAHRRRRRPRRSRRGAERSRALHDPPSRLRPRPGGYFAGLPCPCRPEAARGGGRADARPPQGSAGRADRPPRAPRSRPARTCLRSGSSGFRPPSPPTVPARGDRPGMYSGWRPGHGT